MAQLTLYYFQGCPYCQKVLRFLSKYKIDIMLKDIEKDPKARQELIEKGGKKQVPCLFIDSKPMYESEEILGYLNSRFLNIS